MSGFCGSCGFEVRGGARFCGSCGGPVGDVAVATGGVGRVDRFRVEAVLGRGRAGVLFRAFDPDLGRLVALRQLDIAVTGDLVRYSAVRDAVAVMAGIADPHCVEVFSLLADEAPPLVVSEFVDGVSVEALVAQRGKLGVAAALTALDGALAGLSHVHSLGLVHGFLTPSCVLVDSTGTSKITDVGLGYDRPVPADVGLFLAPEVLAGSGGGQVGVGADVFGASALLYLLITGRAPVMASAAGGAGAGVGGLLGLAGLAGPIRELIVSGLAVDPGARPGSVAVFRQRLEVAAVAVCGSDWRRVGVAALVTAAAATVAVVAVPTAIGVATGLFAAGKAAAATAGVVLGQASAGAAGTGGSAATGGGIMAALAGKPLVVGAVAAGAVAVGGAAAYVVTHDGGPKAGTAIVWSGDATTATPEVVVTATNLKFTAISAGRSNGAQETEAGQHICAIGTDQAAYCWGNGSSGELGGNSQPQFVATPTAVFTGGVLQGKRLVAISAGDRRTCALDSDGAAYCWGEVRPSTGNDETPNLGDGTGEGGAVPVAVDTSGVLAGKKLTQISSGVSTCALDSDGAAYCWGNNYFGEMGTGSKSQPLSPMTDEPVAVSTRGALAGKTLISISTRLGHTCVVDSGGAAYCWGSDHNGELGIGSVEGAGDVLSPQPVLATGVLAGKQLSSIAAGSSSTCAVDTAGSVYCWGSANVIPGHHTTWRQSTPVAIGGPLAGQPVVAPSIGNTGLWEASSDTPCVIAQSATVYCWGPEGVPAGAEGVFASVTVSQPAPLNLGAGAGSQPFAVSGGHGGTAVLATMPEGQPPAPAPAGWKADPSMMTSTLPAIPGSRCLAEPRAIVNGRGEVQDENGIIHAQVNLVAQPQVGRFVPGGTEYSVFAVWCKLGSTPTWVDLFVIDPSGQPVTVTGGGSPEDPYLVSDAIQTALAVGDDSGAEIRAHIGGALSSSGTGLVLRGDATAHGGRGLVEIGYTAKITQDSQGRIAVSVSAS